MALVVWPDRLQNHRVVFWCDNVAVVEIINRHSPKCKQVVTLM